MSQPGPASWSLEVEARFSGSRMWLCDRAHAGTTDANYNAPVAMSGGAGMAMAQRLTRRLTVSYTFR